MRKTMSLWIGPLLALLIAGCETTGSGEGDGAGGPGATGADAAVSGGSGRSGVDARGLDGGYGSGSPLDDPQNPLSKRVIYFKYDSAEIKPEFEPVIAAHARYLGSHPSIQVKLEGHADERGSREYNIALGEQRANSIARMLGIQGVGEGQLRIVSFGEEKPVAYGNDESAWQLNRRVEIVYPGY